MKNTIFCVRRYALFNVNQLHMKLPHSYYINIIKCKKQWWRRRKEALDTSDDSIHGYPSLGCKQPQISGMLNIERNVLYEGTLLSSDKLSMSLNWLAVPSSCANGHSTVEFERLLNGWGRTAVLINKSTAVEWACLKQPLPDLIGHLSALQWHFCNANCVTERPF